MEKKLPAFPTFEETSMHTDRKTAIQTQQVISRRHPVRTQHTTPENSTVKLHTWPDCQAPDSWCSLGSGWRLSVTYREVQAKRPGGDQRRRGKYEFPEFLDLGAKCVHPTIPKSQKPRHIPEMAGLLWLQLASHHGRQMRFLRLQAFDLDFQMV